MEHDLRPGDFLIFQLESAFALLRLLAIDGGGDDKVWHVAAYSDFFPDVESAERAAAVPSLLDVSDRHLALTDRAFASTQTARIANTPLTETELEPLEDWRNRNERSVSDRSIRLLLGLR
jgi:hypothetical protein